MEYPKRKTPRLKGYDYTAVGAYFITICTKERQPILCRITPRDAANVGRDDLGTPYHCPNIQLTEIGKIADKYINLIPEKYENVSLDKYVIMPDHIHILLTLTNDGKRRVESPRRYAVIST